MKLKFTLFATTLSLMLYASTLSAQTTGDYRTTGTGGGAWNPGSTAGADIAMWQTWNGSAWVAATNAPNPTALSSGSNIITISPGDSVYFPTALTAVTLQQIAVSNGGIFTLYNTSATTYTLNNIPSGASISNSGKLYLAGNSVILSGAGTVLNNASGNFTLIFSPTLSANVTNNGTVVLTNTVTITSTITNNNLIVWKDFNVNLNGGTIINNDSVAIQGGTANPTINTSSSGTFTNASGGILYNATAGLATTFTTNVTFNNAGTVKGFGSFNFQSPGTNTGKISPGNNSATILSVNAAFANTGSPVYNLGIYSGGDVAGTNYSQVAFNGAVSLASSTLNVTDNGAGDAAGTTYNLFTTSAGSITGSFATVNLPSSLGNLTNTGTSITVQRITVLPLNWGIFTVTPEGSQAQLSWSTLMESNVSHFRVEHSVDGKVFTSIGTVQAKGNSNMPTTYSFTDPSPSLSQVNYYRLAEVDIDGKSEFSKIRVIQFNGGSQTAAIVRITPNPVVDQMNIVALADNITITINDMSGRVLKTIRMDQGYQQISLSNLPSGVYQVSIYQNQNKVDSKQIMKL